MDYRRSYAEMHALDKRFPGYSIHDYLGSICKMVEEHKPERMLDYGCGKGLQYLARRYHEKWGGLLPYCYDIGIQQLSTKPEGTFGGVICTDVLEHIEKPDLPAIIDELIQFSTGFVLLGISCRPTRKKLPGTRLDVHRTIEPPEWWVKLIEARMNESGRSVHLVAEFDLGSPPHFTTDLLRFERRA